MLFQIIADNIVVTMHVVFKTLAHFIVHLICNKGMALQYILYSDLSKQKCQGRNLLLVKQQAQVIKHIYIYI